jgi:general L-amino acid transport system permease protein
LFSTWYNALLTFLVIWLVAALIRPIIVWNMTEARWGVIEANLTLFMVGQYPRDQLWRLWIVIYLLAALIGLSWGVWKNAARDFAFIGLGAGATFVAISFALGWDTWQNWAIADALLLGLYFIGARVPRLRAIAPFGWLVFFPVIVIIIAGSKYIPGLSPVALSDWGGLLLTLMLAIVGNFGSLPLGILLAIGRRSNLPIVKTFSILYIELIRGVPLVTILYMADVLLPLFLPVDVRPDRVIRAMVGFILFEAAYQAENVRGGLQAIPRGQFEAAQALGLNGSLTLGLIILPQALRAVVPALFNSFISLFKDTSLVAIIGLFELLRIGRSVLAQTEWLGTHIEVFMFAFFVYLAFSLAFSHGARRVEEALGIGKR